MKLHNLKDQNLLRHNEIQKIIGERAQLISDSIGLCELLKIALFYSSEKFVVHALEMYSVSYTACLSEYRHRWSEISGSKLLLMKSFFGYIVSILRVYLLRKLALSYNLMIISSEMRKQYLVDEGVHFTVVVVKNKPVFDRSLINESISRKENVIVLIGNMYSAKKDFVKVANFALLNNINLHCYGLSSGDEAWLKTINFDNVKIFNRVNQQRISEILQESTYSLCLYSNASVNNEYSSSSKVFELLYYGVTPIISSNIGLVHELNSIGANYILIDDDLTAANFQVNNDSLKFSRVCQFECELNLFKNFIPNI